ncbi:MAG: DUF3772 domain-containing protein, partial [Rhodobacteraceae bacterium]|nr:DUF3772 domain-containing protein [Paracoccaceae bacterium]
LRIAGWRKSFDAAKAENSPQIETLKSQIAALGPLPEKGVAEAPEIAQRRRELTEALTRLQAPGLAAVEAFSRAEGIIHQVDALIRDRQAKELLRLLPSPANPLHWPSGYAVLAQGGRSLWAEVTSAWHNPARRAELRNNMPAILICLVLALVLMLRGPGFMERLSVRLQTRAAMRARHVVAALVSLGQVVVPVVGMILLFGAITISGITGPRLAALAGALPGAAFAFFAARWLGSWLFSEDDRGLGPRLTDRPGEARFLVTIIGLVVAAETFRTAFTTEVRPPLSQAAQAVWLAPMVCILAIFLFRLGVLLRRQSPADVGTDGEELQFRKRMISMAGTVIVVVSLVAPALAVIGYVTAANALIWPLVGSLALIGLIILLQRFLTDLYITITKSGDEAREALVPVLTGFLLVFASLPLFALTWGARTADLSEVWTRFQSGFIFGSTRISPSAVVTLFVVFAIGYMLTRLLQGALRSSVLPRTTLDKGAQTAIVSGLGYLGLFLAGLAAVTTAGIDLSALAIVAGALSVGIGFGLQNIVQNFIAGIILLIERPISEGDTIDVGNKSGTVKSISVRSTRIMTGDQAEVIVPNAEFISGIVTNWTRDSLRGRLVMPVTVAYGSDTRKVAAILREIVDAQPLVLIEPAPSVRLSGFGRDGLNFEIRAILSDLNFNLDVQSEINHQIVARFVQEGIEIPFGWQKVLLRKDHTDSLSAAVIAVPVVPTATVPPTADLRTVNNDPSSDPDENENLR